MAPLRAARLSKAATKHASGYFETKMVLPNDEDISTRHHYPMTLKERETFINPKTGRTITAFHYRVYDLVAQIPKGSVTTYKALSQMLGSNGRAVGQALRLNPFWPQPIPCHRVIMSNLAIGGTVGGSSDAQFVANKRAKLIKEGCHFDNQNRLLSNARGCQTVFDSFTLS